MAVKKPTKKKTAKKAPKATGGSKIAKLEQRISALEKKLSGGPAQARPQARPQAPQGARPQMAQGRPQMPQGGAMPRPPMLDLKWDKVEECHVLRCLECAVKMNGSLRYIWYY